MQLPVITSSEDIIIWSIGTADKFSPKSARELIREYKPVIKEIKVCWAAPIIPRCSFFSWLIFKERLPTLDKQKKWQIHMANRCILCTQEEETLEHLLLYCPYSISVWDQLNKGAKNTPLLANNVKELFLKAYSTFKGKNAAAKKGRVFFNLTLYNLWIERNKRTFMQQARRPADLASTIWSAADALLQQQARVL